VQLSNVGAQLSNVGAVANSVEGLLPDVADLVPTLGTCAWIPVPGGPREANAASIASRHETPARHSLNTELCAPTQAWFEQGAWLP
jgi:hypothetical protein